jgi:hypothetical protein
VSGRMHDDFNPDELFHPAAFGHPSEVLNDLDLTIDEKRAILASWASDACAIEASPDLRAGRKGSPVRFDDIMDALRMLDRQANGSKYRRVLQRRRVFGGAAEAARATPALRSKSTSHDLANVRY